MDAFSPTQFFDLSRFSHKAIFENCGAVWQALDRIKDYLASYPLGKNEAEEQQFAYLVNPETISIGEGTIIEPGAYIRGPCIIGKNCHIRHGAYIRGEVIVGDHCVVGHTTELKGVIMLDHAHAAHFAYVGDSIIGNQVNLGAGVKCANLRLDGKPIVLHYKNERIATNRRKFGAIIGDHSQVGCNTVLNPGTIMAKRVLLFPCLSCHGIIEEGSVIRC